ncbi:TIGR00730 family Rossman fold protein [Pseudomonas sp. P3C3]
MSLKSVCVFCGASPGARPIYHEAAAQLGRHIAERGLTLVYGGGAVGLMGVVADAALAAGGEVIGIIPQSLERAEIGHKGLSRLEVVDGMHARKARMAELADAFIALPGGLGTLEELFEVWTWGQLGYHAKPLGLLEVEGFYARLTDFLDHLVAERFVREQHRAILQIDASPAALLDRMSAWQPTAAPKWVDREPKSPPST